MTTDPSLYEQDFARRSEEQAGAIRAAASAGANLPLDWENIAEEIESLGRSLRTQLRSRIANIIEPLLKLRHSPAEAPRRGWTETVQRERRDSSCCWTTIRACGACCPRSFRDGTGARSTSP